MSGVRYCPNPYNEIIDGLFVGGHDYQPDGTGWPLDAIIGDEFDLVISLFQRPGLNYGPAAGAQHFFLRVPDGGLTDVELTDIRTLADWAAEAVRDGKRVLCRCQAGINRSSLVAAFTMLRLGHGPDEAIALIRAKRSPQALFNTHFQAYIAAEAERLTSLNGGTR